MVQFGQRKVVGNKEYEYRRDARGGNHGSWFLVNDKNTGLQDNTMFPYDDFHDDYSETGKKALDFESVVKPGSMSDEASEELLDVFSSMSETIDRELVSAPSMEIQYSKMNEEEVIDYLTDGSNAIQEYTSNQLMDRLDCRGFKAGDGKYFVSVDTRSMYGHDDQSQALTHATNDQLERIIDSFAMLEDRDKNNIKRNKSLIEKIRNDNPGEVKSGYGIYNGKYEDYVVDHDEHYDADGSRKLDKLKDQVACDRLLDSVAVPCADLGLHIDRTYFTRGARPYTYNFEVFRMPSKTDDGGRDDVILTSDGHCLSKNKPNKPSSRVKNHEIGRTGRLFEQAVDYYDEARELADKYPIEGSQLNNIAKKGKDLTSPEKAAYVMAYVAEHAQIREKITQLDLHNSIESETDPKKLKDAYQLLNRVANIYRKVDETRFINNPHTPREVINGILDYNDGKSWSSFNSIELNKMRANPHADRKRIDQWEKDNKERVERADAILRDNRGADWFTAKVTEDPFSDGHWISLS